MTTTAEIARWIAPQIAERIERAAWWPEHTLRANWKLGDYSAYVVAFPAPGFRMLQVRFVSEPDGPAPRASAPLRVQSAWDRS